MKKLGAYLLAGVVVAGSLVGGSALVRAAGDQDAAKNVCEDPAVLAPCNDGKCDEAERSISWEDEIMSWKELNAEEKKALIAMEKELEPTRKKIEALEKKMDEKSVEIFGDELPAEDRKEDKVDEKAELKKIETFNKETEALQKQVDALYDTIDAAYKKNEKILDKLVGHLDVAINAVVDASYGK